MNDDFRSRHVPIAAQITALDWKQRRIVQKILFWFLLAYLELWTLDAAAQDFLIAAVAGAVAVLLLRKTEVGRRPNFVVLHAAMVASIFWSALRGNQTLLLIDGGLLATLVTLELVHRSRVILALIVVEHAVGLFVSPWNAHSTALGQAHLIARLFAIVLVIAIAIPRPDADRRTSTLRSDGPPPAPGPEGSHRSSPPG